MIEFLTKKKNQRGFTLLEAIISTTIVMVGIIGILIVSQDAVLIVYDARDRLTVAYLAKEGTEIVRNIRDENWLRREVWNIGLAPGTYEADFDDTVLGAWANTLLRVDHTTRIFSYDPADDPTIFRRKITIDSLAAGVDGIKVEVMVKWPDRPGQPDHSFLLEENLYNWR